MVGARVPQILFLSTLLGCIVSLAEANVYISLRNATTNETRMYTKYNSIVFYDTWFSSIDEDGLSGYLHQPEYNDDEGCYNVSSLPSASVNESWFVVLEFFPFCSLSSLLDDIKNAGYSLVIVANKPSPAYNPNIGLSTEVRNKTFPIVIIKKVYTEYLIKNAISDFSNPQISATVNADGDLFLLVMVMIAVFIAVPLFLIFCGLCCYWRALRLRRYQEVVGIQRRRRNFERLTDHDHIARRELIDSILRQLQQLQVEGEIQRPLGADSTRKLPTRTYEATSTPESCAICVEEFKSRDILRVLPCKHFFHISCIDEWLTNHSDLCPLCKSQVLQDQPEDHRTGRRGVAAAMASFDETEETDSESLLVSVDRRQGHSRPYGSV